MVCSETQLISLMPFKAYLCCLCPLLHLIRGRCDLSSLFPDTILGSIDSLLPGAVSVNPDFPCLEANAFQHELFQAVILKKIKCNMFSCKEGPLNKMSKSETCSFAQLFLYMQFLRYHLCHVRVCKDQVWSAVT